MINDLKIIPPGSVVLLHACAHNPTGMDPTKEQWQEISKVMKDGKLIPFFDCAYQGFASGNAPEDAFAIRMFVEDGHQLATVQSFSKNFGLYGQRVGALSIVTADEDEAKKVLSQMKMAIRPMYSNPPKHGAQLVKTILSDERLSMDFINQCADMAKRINEMRIKLRTALEEGGDRNWEHITKQIGMVSTMFLIAALIGYRLDCDCLLTNVLLSLVCI
jgi:Aspartate/tyrosine/aromatic aminotransferase